MPEAYEQLQFADAAEWDAWLAANADGSAGVQLRTAR
jgi:hypothetical protein